MPNYLTGRSALRMLATALVYLACLLSGAAVHAKPALYTTGAAPAWVVPVATPNAAGKPNTDSGGVEELLVDVQSRIDAKGRTTYWHYARKSVDGTGITRAASISASFDPTYQQLALHHVDIIRDGRRISKLASSDIRVLQRETALEYQLYDGNQTVNIAIDDVRVGDIVDYAYSTSGLNPVFNNLVSGGASLQWGVPVARVSVRLLAPLGRELVITPRNTKVQPVVSEAAGYRQYLWSLTEVPALRVEKDTPKGFDPYPEVTWSEFKDWSQVTAWALPLYRTPANPGQAISAEIERIGRTETTAAGRVAAVLKLVQRDIRYLGIEVGPGSHAPTAPEVVYKRRFGDCKDKAMLMLTMLKGLGIDAYPALVDTDGALKAGTAASPNAFNHVIVHALADGKKYWLDPTSDEQTGDLDHLYQPDYGMALVLDSATRALVRMAPPVNARTVTKTVIDSRKGVDQPVTYAIETTYHGSEADRIRGQLAGTGKADKEKEYLNFYARSYPTISLAAPLEVSDDKQRNALTLKESYAIKTFWNWSSDGNRREMMLETDISPHLAAPKSVRRQDPLAISFPEEMDETFIVLLPEQWDLKPGRMSVVDPAFEYSKTVTRKDNGHAYVFDYHYKALADRDAPDALAKYAARLSEANDTAGQLLYWEREGAPANKRASFDWRTTAAVLLFAGWILLGLIWLTTPPEHSKTDGILLCCLVGTSAVFLMVAAVVDSPTALILGGLASYAVLAHTTLGAGRNAPATHWAHGLANPAASTKPGTYRRVSDAIAHSRIAALVALAGVGVARLLP